MSDRIEAALLALCAAGSACVDERRWGDTEERRRRADEAGLLISQAMSVLRGEAGRQWPWTKQDSDELRAFWAQKAAAEKAAKDAEVSARREGRVPVRDITGVVLWVPKGGAQ